MNNSNDIQTSVVHSKKVYNNSPQKLKQKGISHIKIIDQLEGFAKKHSISNKVKEQSTP